MVWRTLEAIFRQPIRLLILIVTLPLISFAIAYIQPRSYQASANLWALRRFAIISATGPEADTSQTPADTQTATFSQLLQTRTFALTVAKATDLASTYDPSVRSDPQSLDDAMYNDISQGVQVQSQGADLFVVSYVNNNPKIAQEVVAAAIQTFGLQSLGFTTFEGKRLLENYQTQLVEAKQNAAAAAAAEAQYLAAHPALANEISHTDPANAASIDANFTPLHSRTQQAQGAVESIQSNITALSQSINTQGSSADDLYRVLDPPVMPLRPVSHQRQLLVGGGIGLGIAILACAFYLVFIIRLDRGIYTLSDLKKVTTFPVVMQLPHLNSTAVSLLVKRQSR